MRRYQSRTKPGRRSWFCDSIVFQHLRIIKQAAADCLVLSDAVSGDDLSCLLKLHDFY